MDRLRRIAETLEGWVWTSGIPIGDETFPLVVLVLLGAGLYFTLRLGIIQVRAFGHGLAVVTGRYDDPDDSGDVTHFQALSTALSATVGIGNIAGVAIALHWGGPGALFWMWVTAVLGMATKFAEVTLAQHYREVVERGPDHPIWKGTVSGGPMYYIERGLGPRWKPLAVFFAVGLGIAAFLTGNGIQANTVADVMRDEFRTPLWISGLFTASVVALVILGGIRRIGQFTSILAPAMATVYVMGALVIIALNWDQVLPTLGLIVTEAFNPSAGVAGVGVGAFLVTLMWGARRGLFSNEAGMGSAPIAHAAARTDEPVSEGVVALLEPFIDTLVVCTMTALVILMTGAWGDRLDTEIALDSGTLSWVLDEGDGRFQFHMAPPEAVGVVDGVPVETGPGTRLLAWNESPVDTFWVDEDRTERFTGTILPGPGHAETEDGRVLESLRGDAPLNGAPLTMEGFRRGLPGDWGQYVVLLTVLLFAISTAIAWSYYGDRCAYYLFGDRAVLPYKVIFVVMHFLGAVVPLAVAWTIGDVFLGIVIIPNLLAIVLLTPKLKEITRDYFRRRPWESG